MELMRRHLGHVGADRGSPGPRGLIEAGEHVQRRGLAGAVRADQRVKRRTLDLDIDIIDRLEAAEIFARPLTSSTMAPPTVAEPICSAGPATRTFAFARQPLGSRH